MEKNITYSSNHVLMSIQATTTVKRLPAIQSDSRESPLLCTQTTRIVNIICLHCTEVAGNIAFVHSHQIFQRNRLQTDIELEFCVRGWKKIDLKKLTHGMDAIFPSRNSRRNAFCSWYYYIAITFQCLLRPFQGTSAVFIFEPATIHLLRLHVQYVKPTTDCIYHKLSVVVRLPSLFHSHLPDFSSLYCFFCWNFAGEQSLLKWFFSVIFHTIFIWSHAHIKCTRKRSKCRIKYERPFLSVFLPSNGAQHPFLHFSMRDECAGGKNLAQKTLTVKKFNSIIIIIQNFLAFECLFLFVVGMEIILVILFEYEQNVFSFKLYSPVYVRYAFEMYKVWISDARGKCQIVWFELSRHCAWNSFIVVTNVGFYSK